MKLALTHLFSFVEKTKEERCEMKECKLLCFGNLRWRFPPQEGGGDDNDAGQDEHDGSGEA